MSELRQIGRHAATVYLGQMAVMAFGVTDTIIAGRYSGEALAALAVGSAIFISVYVALMGVLQALLPIWAELHGAGRQRKLGASLRQSLYLCALFCFLGMALLLWPGSLLEWAEVPASMRPLISDYLQLLAWALLPTLLFRLYSTLNQSLGRPKLVTWLQLSALTLKVPLSVLFCFGGAGLPAQGLVGCALATLLIDWLMLALALWLLRTQQLYRPLALWQPIEAPDWAQLRQFLRLGLPAGLSVAVEITSFTLMALFIARMGTAAMAAHQIAASLTSIAYMAPMSLGIATSARVSYWIGAGQPLRARRTALQGLGLTLWLALCAMTMILLLRDPLARIYTRDAQVLPLTSGLLAIIALYQLPDALQIFCAFVLRSYRVTVLPLLIYSLMLWGLGLGGGYMLAYRSLGPWPAQHSPQAFWLMGTLALLLTALLFVTLLALRLRQRCSVTANDVSAMPETAT